MATTYEQTCADVLTRAAELLAWSAAQKRVNDADCDGKLRAAAECIILSDTYRKLAEK
jgi:hypothetical protein